MVLSYLKLSFSLLLWSAWCWCNPVHPDTLAYFSLLLWAIWGWCNPVHIDTVVLSFLKLSFSLPLWSAWCWCNPVHPDTLAYFFLPLWAIWGWCNPVHIDAVVYSCCLLSFLELSLAGYDDELLLAVGAFYKTESLRIDGNSCLCLLSFPAPARTLSALARVSLASGAPLRVDQLIRRGVSVTYTWSHSLAPRPYSRNSRYSLHSSSPRKGRRTLLGP